MCFKYIYFLNIFCFWLSYSIFFANLYANIRIRSLVSVFFK